MDYVARLTFRPSVGGAERDVASVSAAGGLRIGPEVFGRLRRLQP